MFLPQWNIPQNWLHRTESHVRDAGEVWWPCRPRVISNPPYFNDCIKIIYIYDSVKRKIKLVFRVCRVYIRDLSNRLWLRGSKSNHPWNSNTYIRTFCAWTELDPCKPKLSFFLSFFLSFCFLLKCRKKAVWFRRHSIFLRAYVSACLVIGPLTFLTHKLLSDAALHVLMTV